MVDKNKCKKYIKNYINDITFYIRQTRYYRWNFQITTRYQQYIKDYLRDLIHYFNKF